MPLKLTVGLSKKVGQPDYGSLGASCHVEVELDSSLLHANDLAPLHARVRHAFVACGQAVDEELARYQQRPHSSPASPTLPPSPPQSNGRVPSVTSSVSPAPRCNANGSHASQKQQDYVAKLAKQIHGLGAERLDEIVGLMFRKPAGQLSGFEASALIDQLKAIKEGQVRLEDVLRELSV